MDWKKIWKYTKKYGPYIAAVSFLIKIGILYAGKVATTGDWHPFRFRKEKTEKADELKSNLEKTIMFEDFYCNKQTKSL